MVGGGVEATALMGALSGKTSRSQSITQSISTTTGSSTTVGVQVLPFGRVRMDRGVEAIDVVYDLDSWEISDGRCWYQPSLSPHGVFVDAPTTGAGWRTVTWPIINQGGVVNGRTYSTADIHPDTVVAIFGPIFFPHQDRVVVRQDGATYTIQDGSPWWYNDSPIQINASLPGSAALHPGPATVNVISRPVDLAEDVEDLVSNTITINIIP